MNEIINQMSSYEFIRMMTWILELEQKDYHVVSVLPENDVVTVKMLSSDKRFYAKKKFKLNRSKVSENT